MFRIGDDVKLRTWDSLANEYGEDKAGDILVHGRGWTTIWALSDNKAVYGTMGFILSIFPHDFMTGVFNGQVILINDGKAWLTNSARSGAGLIFTTSFSLLFKTCRCFQDEYASSEKRRAYVR